MVDNSDIELVKLSVESIVVKLSEEKTTSLDDDELTGVTVDFLSKVILKFKFIEIKSLKIVGKVKRAVTEVKFMLAMAVNREVTTVTKLFRVFPTKVALALPL